MKTIKINEDTKIRFFEDNSFSIIVHDEFSGETSKVFIEKDTFEEIKKEVENNGR
jgi:hypothetical protein